jgi:hypothetical protein
MLDCSDTAWRARTADLRKSPGVCCRRSGRRRHAKPYAQPFASPRQRWTPFRRPTYGNRFGRPFLSRSPPFRRCARAGVYDHRAVCARGGGWAGVHPDVHDPRGRAPRELGPAHNGRNGGRCPASHIPVLAGGRGVRGVEGSVEGFVYASQNPSQRQPRSLATLCSVLTSSASPVPPLSSPLL